GTRASQGRSPGAAAEAPPQPAQAPRGDDPEAGEPGDERGGGLPALERSGSARALMESPRRSGDVPPRRCRLGAAGWAAAGAAAALAGVALLAAPLAGRAPRGPAAGAAEAARRRPAAESAAAPAEAAAASCPGADPEVACRCLLACEAFRPAALAPERCAEEARADPTERVSMIRALVDASTEHGASDVCGSMQCVLACAVELGCVREVRAGCERIADRLRGSYGCALQCGGGPAGSQANSSLHA
ncbi:unnamed protein product, partial [Prorocentrum cordatum]